MLAYMSNLINFWKRGTYQTKENVGVQTDGQKYQVQLERDFWNTRRSSLRGKYRQKNSNNNSKTFEEQNTQVGLCAHFVE